jgi:hypothetical protein
MLMDKQLEFSGAQAVTTTALSTEYVDQLAPGNAVNPGARVIVKTRTAFANATSMTIELLTDNVTTFNSAALKTLWSSGAIAEADLTINKILADFEIPVGALRYLTLKYTVDGTHNAGTIDGAIVLNSDIGNINQGV